MPFSRAHRKAAQLPALDMLGDTNHWVEHERKTAGHYLSQGRRVTAEGHMRHFSIGHHGKQRGGKMRGPAIAGGTIGYRTGPRPRRLHHGH